MLVGNNCFSVSTLNIGKQ
uniref:Uncharacterized protein n=1 Tax=Anguilla anguilla TaxID=7936 RepID=A0A0E9VBZ3_ANGAN